MNSPSTLTTYRAYADGFADAIAPLNSTDWDAPSACAGWTTRDVLAHMVDTQRDFLTTHNVSLPSRPKLDDPVSAWQEHRRAVEAALGDSEIVDREIDTYFGPAHLGATLLQFYGFDMVAHRWDVVAATDREYRFSAEDLVFLETTVDSFGDALYADGICERISVPDTDDRQVVVLAKLGRAS